MPSCAVCGADCPPYSIVFSDGVLRVDYERPTYYQGGAAFCSPECSLEYHNQTADLRKATS